MELVNGTKGRSGEQLDIWSAVFGPLGKDGYFEPLFDKRTGVMNRAVADYWREHYDLLEYLKRNWTTVGPKLVDKVHVYTGTMDNFFLEQLDPRARGVDEDDAEPALRRLLPLWRRQRPLLAGTRNDGRAPEADGGAHRPPETGRHDHSVVEIPR